MISKRRNDICEISHLIYVKFCTWSIRLGMSVATSSLGVYTYKYLYDRLNQLNNQYDGTVLRRETVSLSVRFIDKMAVNILLTCFVWPLWVQHKTAVSL